MATIRTTGVVRKVTSAAVRRTTAYSRTDSAAALRLVPRRLRVCRVSGNQLPDAGGHLGDAAAFGVADGGADEGRDLLHVGLGHALGRARGAAAPDARGDGGGLRSNGIAFLLSTMPAASQRASASAPVTPVSRRSSRARWVSVPPATGRSPSAASPSVSAWALAMTWRA